jgi:mono/diheme cytochrome c family protein
MARLSRIATLLALATLAAAIGSHAFAADNAAIQRGKYLVEFGGCSDCHTPGSLLGKPDMSRYLGGSDVGFAIPGLGVFVGANLTPDDATGIGKFSASEIVTAIRTGVLPDGRVLAPAMPWQDFANLTDADAMAIAAYLKSLPRVSHKVPGPFGPNEKVTVFVMPAIPPDVYNSLPKPEAPPK